MEQVYLKVGRKCSEVETGGKVRRTQGAVLENRAPRAQGEGASRVVDDGTRPAAGVGHLSKARTGTASAPRSLAAALEAG